MAGRKATADRSGKAERVKAERGRVTNGWQGDFVPGGSRPPVGGWIYASRVL